MCDDIEGEKRSEASVLQIVEALREVLAGHKGGLDCVTDVAFEFTPDELQLN